MANEQLGADSLQFLLVAPVDKTLNPWTSNSRETLNFVVEFVDYYNKAHPFPLPSLAPVTRPHGCSLLRPGVLYRWITEE